MVLLAACVDHGGGSGNGGGDGPGPACPALALLVRDPVTGACEEVSGCGLDEILLDRAVCASNCTALDPADCIAAAGCHAAYFVDASGAESFLGCWATASARPGATGACAGLDAVGCSRRDDCSMVYASASGDEFASCVAEPPTE